MISIAARPEVSARLNTLINEWRSGKGAMVFVTGETGMGKSHLVEQVADEMRAESAIRVDCTPPIGHFNISNIQPLQPFGRAIEQLYLNGERAAKRKLAMNIGMSLLASLPIAGDIFYAVKAISQDVSEYQKETAATTQKKRSAVMECVESLEAIAKDHPFVLLVDDGQWCDPQSVEVLRVLSRRISECPLLIIWTTARKEAESSNLALSLLLREMSTIDNTIGLGSVHEEHFPDLVAGIDDSIAPSQDQMHSLFERSAGTPGIVVEYVKYLRKTGQVDEKGVIREDALRESGLKLSGHPATDVLLHDINEEDSLMMSLCAAEGQEFTAFMLAALTNTDIITVIRQLRRLEHTTGVIKSLGMRTRYGVKTTTYSFTQGVAYTYFLHYPEYEERKYIHHRIAEILSAQHDQMDVDEVRHQIAAIVAAHATEAEDEELAAIMLHEAASAAESMGAFDTASYIRTTLLTPVSGQPTSLTDADDGASGGGGTGASMGEGGGTGAATTSNVTTTVVDLILSGEPEQARRMASQHLERTTVGTHDETILRCLIARAEVELNRMADALHQLDLADALRDTTAADRCIVLNLRALVAIQNADHQLADAYLLEAARIAGKGETSHRLLTLANIVLMNRHAGGTDSGRFESSLQGLLADHSLVEFKKDMVAANDSQQ